MTTQDFAAMLEGWPEAILSELPPVMFKGTPSDPGGPWWIMQPYSMKQIVDLACMSGLRHLENLPSVSRVVLNKAIGPDEVLTLIGPMDGAFGDKHTHYRRPTLLHAIDAAVRSSK